MNQKPRSYAPSQKAQRSRTTGEEAVSRRRMSAGRRLWYGFLVMIARAGIRLLWSTCKVEKVIGAEQVDALLAGGKPIIPCYWHSMQLFCAKYMLQLRDRGLHVGFLISPSVSGEAAAMLARSWKAEVVRGSPTRTGGQALRDMYLIVNRDGVSPVITVDGPKGPAEVVKNGAVLLARLTRAPMVPMAYAAAPSWRLRTWDRFLLPRPFSRIVLAVGEPLEVPAGTAIDDLEPLRAELERRIQGAEAAAEAAVARSGA
jgi:lysophospholipid acyltransferase (LPLAT)-like uncharacterized protein